MLSASVEEGGLDRGLEALLVEAERARRHGFLASELEREKTELLRGYEQAWAERDKTDSGAYASEYVGQLPRGRADPRHRVRGRAGAPLRPRHHAGRGQPPGRELPAGEQPRDPGRGSGGGGRRQADRGAAPRHLRARGRARRPALEGPRGRGAAARRRAPAGRDRRAQAARGHRHHRVAARERRPRHPQADRLQERPGDVHRLQHGRTLAGGGRRTGCRRSPPTRSPRWAASASSA